MKSKYYVLIIIMMFDNISFSAQNNSGIEKKIHESSQKLRSSINYNLVSESLYNQIRPRANITKFDLTSEEIDNRVRKYISEKYTPALVTSYEKIYSDFREEKNKFDNCNTLSQVIKKDDILKSLCIVIGNSEIEIRYMTNAYSRGWKISSIFKFVEVRDGYEMVSIDILLSGDQRAYIEGV